MPKPLPPGVYTNSGRDRAPAPILAPFVGWVRALGVVLLILSLVVIVVVLALALTRR